MIAVVAGLTDAVAIVINERGLTVVGLACAPLAIGIADAFPSTRAQVASVRAARLAVTPTIATAILRLHARRQIIRIDADDHRIPATVRVGQAELHAAVSIGIVITLIPDAVVVLIRLAGIGNIVTIIEVVTDAVTILIIAFFG